MRGGYELLSEELSYHQVVAEGGVPCLGGLTTQELVQGCEAWFGIKLIDSY